jgi:CheY-like chemotaxis protein
MDEHKTCHDLRRRTGAILDVSPGMKVTSIAIAPESGRKLMNVPLPQWEISGPVARKTPRRILVVDDEPLIRWSVTETLAGLGLDVEQAGDAASALRLVVGGPRAFDIILLDLRLPDMRDLSLMGTRRQLQPDASIILMTAFGTDEIVEHAIELGVEAVLNKPFELGTLVDAVYGVSP